MFKRNQSNWSIHRQLAYTEFWVVKQKVCEAVGLISTKREPQRSQCCNDPSDIGFIENNGVASKLGCSPFWNNSIVFNENCIASVIAVLTLH